MALRAGAGHRDDGSHLSAGRPERLDARPGGCASRNYIVDQDDAFAKRRLPASESVPDVIATLAEASSGLLSGLSHSHQ
jgi:hypothetical protein